MDGNNYAWPYAKLAFGGDGVQTKVSASNPLPITGSITASPASVGTTGSSVPSSADFIGFNSGGNLTGVSASSPFPVTVGSGTVSISGTPSVTVSSGTVTVNAGTNLNTSALALESGGNLATVANNTTKTTAGTTATSALPVQGVTGGVALPVSGSVSISSGTVSISGTVPVSGTFYQATQPVSLSSLPALATGSNSIGTVGVTSLPSLPTGSNTIGSVNGITKGTASAITPIVNNYSTTNVTTSAYVQLVASTSSAINQLQIFDSSGQALYLATGAAGSEVNQLVIFPGGNGTIALAIPASTRIAIKAISGTASSGSLYINGLS